MANMNTTRNRNDSLYAKGHQRITNAEKVLSHSRLLTQYACSYTQEQNTHPCKATVQRPSLVRRVTTQHQLSTSGAQYEPSPKASSSCSVSSLSSSHASTAWLDDEDTDRCGVCLNTIDVSTNHQQYDTEDTIVRIRNCNHKFCMGCIYQWLKMRNSCPCCRQRIDLFDVLDGTRDEPKYNPCFRDGDEAVFVQGNTVGLASYHFTFVATSDPLQPRHFVDIADACISYANPRCKMWGTLDDGNQIPQHKKFVNASYDNETRTFSGEIHWPVPLMGESKWVYTMHFDDKFKLIESGNIRTFNSKGVEGKLIVFCQDLFYQRLITLDDLIKGVQNHPTTALPSVAASSSSECGSKHTQCCRKC